MTEATINGAGIAFDPATDLEEMTKLAVSRGIVARERPEPSAKPFNQQAHDLLLKSIDQVAADWVGELEHVRKNSQEVEELVLQRAAKVKGDITALYLLGNAALTEAKRGDEVNARLASELDRLSETPA